MEFEIDPANIFDSPYSPAKDDFFIFKNEDLDNLSSDILYGNPTCYLVSGYRGVGKSSFIRKLQNRIESKSEGVSSTIFVESSFAAYGEQSFAIRKLIRQLYLNLDSWKLYNELPVNKKSTDLKSKLALLYQRTFNEVLQTNERSELNTSEHSMEINKATVSSLLALILPCALLFLKSVTIDETSLLSLITGTSLSDIIQSNGFSLLLFISSALAALNLKYRFTRRKNHLNKLLTKTLYDEEIAGHHFSDILQSLHQHGIRVVFVLDELDKVNDSEVESLINEMKPYLVSGYASFIVVSGQQLFYRYFMGQNKDDSVLSTLFSKVVHIPLASPLSLAFLFNEKVVKNLKAFEDDQIKEINKLLSYYIFRSRLIPRRFFTLLRQDIYWKNHKAFLSTNQSQKILNEYTEIVDVLNQLIESQISFDSHHEAIKDYLTMALFIEAEVQIRSAKT
jgi:GTP-binding protein EngB required for normal cell division